MKKIWKFLVDSLLDSKEALMLIFLIGFLFLAFWFGWMNLSGDGPGSKKYQEQFHYYPGVASSFRDSRDGQTYSVMGIYKDASRETLAALFMLDNLNYNYNVKTAKSFCYADSCAKYGRLYNWAAAMDSAKIYSGSVCPEGWRLPSKEDWQKYRDVLSESSWWTPFDEPLEHFIYTFYSNADFAGRRDVQGKFLNVQQNAYFWSSTELNAAEALGEEINFVQPGISANVFKKDEALSVRCMKEFSP